MRCHAQKASCGGAYDQLLEATLPLTMAAFLALYKFKVDVLWVVITGGLIDLAWTLLVM